MTPAQAQAALRKAQREQKQAIDRYNRDVRKYNAAVKKAANDYNRKVRTYNSEARSHNAQVRSQVRRLQTELNRLNSRPSTSTYVTLRASADLLTQSYFELEERTRVGTARVEEGLVELGGEEAENSVHLLNALDGDDSISEVPTEEELREPSMEHELRTFSQDLLDRWHGALFALSPRNPDAARHFCTSAREVLIAMLNTSAPPSAVLAQDPRCEMTQEGIPTRRSQVRYLLSTPPEF